MKRHAFAQVDALLLGGALLLFGAAMQPSGESPSPDSDASAGEAGEGLIGRARENARRASCQSNLKQIGIGLLQYSQDYDEKLPLAASGQTSSYDGYGWATGLHPYLKSSSVFQCPSESHPSPVTYTTPAPGTDVFYAAQTLPGLTDYWYNRAFSGTPLSAIAEPARTLAMGDGDGGNQQSTARYSIPSLPASWRTTPGSPARRHLEMGNYAFADGHVKALPPAQVTTYPLSKLPFGAGTFKLK